MYEYTKPRGPIAAYFKSPGPCYGLPQLVGSVKHDPRSVHNKAPAWAFGIRHGKLSHDSSPGPVHYPDSHYTRTGMDGTPHYSLYGRPRNAKLFQPPGPGAYRPEDAGPSASPRAPMYSLGLRCRQRSSDGNPAPNSYTLPRLLGKTVEGGRTTAPAYSQRGRSTVGGFDQDLQKTPGPGTYSSIDPNIYQKRTPLYTMRPRVSMPGDSTRKPGPGAHYPENVNVTKKMNPKISFGIRHSNYVTPLIIDACE